MKTVPASPIQERFWLQAQLDPSNSACHLTFVHSVTGLLDLQALQGAIDTLVERHESLRTTVVDQPQGLAVALHDTLPSPLTLHRVDPEEFAEAQTTFLARMHQPPFDLTADPLIRAGVLSAGPDRHLLVTVIHRMAVDDADLPALFEDLALAYGGGEDATAPAGTALVDPLPPDPAESASAYWRTICAEMPTQTPLPTVGAGPGDRVRSATRPLPEEVLAGLRRLAGARDATLFEAFAAGWAAFLCRYTGQATVAFAYPVSLGGDEARQMGCTTNTLPMHLEAEGATFGLLLDRAAEARRSAVPHQEMTWEQIVRDLRAQGHLGGDQPLLNVSFGPGRPRQIPLPLAGVTVSAQAPPAEGSIWTLALEYEGEAPTTLRLIGREDRFPDWLLEALVETVIELLTQAIANPETPIEALSLVDEPHRIRLAAHGQGRTPDEGVQGTLAERFAEVAATHADSVAVQSGVDGLTYWALDIRSNRTAHALVSRLEGASPGAPPTATHAPGDRVGLLFKRSPEAIITVVAMAKLGLTCVPLRPTDTPTRWAELLEHAGAIAVVGQHRLLDLLPESLTLPRFAVDAPGSMTGQADTPVSCVVDPEAPAYLMYAAASTGEPSGVLVPHRAVLGLNFGGGVHGLRADDTVVHGANLAFRLSIWESWGALLAGATMLVVSRSELLDTGRLQEKISTHGATAMAISAPLFATHVDASPDLFAGLRLLIVAEDVLEPAQAARLLADGRVGTLLNAYGTVEGGVFSTVARVSEAEVGRAVPIGRPVAGTRCRVVDDAGRLVPTGFPGELWVGGLGVGLGLHGHRAQATDGFVETPDLGRAYRTADRVRWRADGQLDLLGRMDATREVRGHWIDPSEVATHAMGHPDVRQAVVVSATEGEAGLIFAYTLALRSRLDDDGMRRHLAQALPGFAIPTRRVRLEAMPMTDDGTIDVEAIRSLAPDTPPRATADAPATTETEHALVALWSEALGQSDVSVIARFVDLGGDSLKAARLTWAIREALEAEIGIADLYRLETIRDLARHLDGAEVDKAQGLIEPPPSVPATERPPTVPLSLSQTAQWQLLRRNQGHGASLLTHLQTRLDVHTFQEALDDVLCRHELPWMLLDRDEPIMRRGSARASNIMRMDLTCLEPKAARYQAMSRVRRSAQEPFQNRIPMVSVFLAQAAHDSWYLGLTAPNALADQATLRLLGQEVHDAYLARLDGAPFLPPVPMSLMAYMAWERAHMNRGKIEESVAFYEGRLRGDASWTVPTSHIQQTVHGETCTLDTPAVERLKALGETLNVSLETTLTYCVFLALHGVHQVALVRCQSAHDNRDEPQLERLPLTMAGAMYHESHLDDAQSFREGLRTFDQGFEEALTHAKLPVTMLTEMRLLLLTRGRLSHSLPARIIATLWALFTPTPRVVLMVATDAAIASFFQGLRQRIGGWVGGGRTRTAGCFISVTGSLSEHTPLGSTRLPMSEVRTPNDLPTTTPGDPQVHLHRDIDGVKALVQARYQPAAVRALAAAYDATVAAVASTPDAPLGELLETLAAHREAFERADDEV